MKDTYTPQENIDSCAADVPGSEGLPLEAALRADLEARFHRDIGRVRIHADESAASSAEALGSDAFTYGSDIVFAKGRFAPETDEGMWLLCHELAHVVQQSMADFGPASQPAGFLERQADEVADIVASGRPLPADFAFHAASRTIQRHVGPVCPGTTVSATDRTIWMPANEAIEMAYKNDLKTGPVSALFFGSQFETGRDVLPPAGVPNRKFAVTLLRNLRGLVHQRRPDIIDFKLRVMYEIKTVRYAQDGLIQAGSYYTIADEIRREHAFSSEPPWRAEYATWYPPHILPFPTDTLRTIVCTQATDYKRYPAVILYDVRKLSEDERRKRRMKKVKAHRLVDHEPEFGELLPRLKSEMDQKVLEFDPENPEYVIIVPRRFYLDWQKMKTDQMVDKMRVPLPPFLDKRNPIGQFRSIGWTVIGITAAAYATLYVVAGASLLAPVAAGGAAAAGGGAAAAGGGGGAAVIPLAAFRALSSAPAAKPLAEAAGVLIVLGTIGDARAESPTVSEVSSIRAVPVSDFRSRNGVQTAKSERSPFDTGFDVCQETSGKFEIHTEVMFDGEPHYIIARAQAG